MKIRVFIYRNNKGSLRAKSLRVYDNDIIGNDEAEKKVKEWAEQYNKTLVGFEDLEILIDMDSAKHVFKLDEDYNVINN